MIQFEQIYKIYFADVYKYVLRLSGNESTAEDITCETFFKAMNAIDRFRGDCDIRVWLCQIAKNLYYNQLKKEKRITGYAEDEIINIEDPGVNAEEKVILSDDADRIQILLHELKEPYKEVFMWRVYGEMSFKQIGKLFGKSENWACVTYYRAKTIIGKRMEENR